MSWCIDEIEFDSFPFHTDRRELDSDATFSFEVHLIKGLREHFSFLKRTCDLHKAICESRLSMVDMGNDTKIADRSGFGHGRIIARMIKKAKKSHINLLDTFF